MSIPDLPRPQGGLGGFPLSRQLIIGHDSVLSLEAVDALYETQMVLTLDVTQSVSIS